MDYATEIAARALDIGAITLSPDNPYTWASGFRMPIYNDNRKHLAYPENRKLITDAFEQFIKENGPIELIAGTTTAGIAPAASLAQRLKVPMHIIEAEIIHQYSPEFIRALADQVETADCDVVISTCPAAIIPAVFVANDKKLPFAYVREQLKDHGLKQQIEGIVQQGQRAVLVNFYNNYSYVEAAKKVLEEKGLTIIRTISKDLFPHYKTPEFAGNTILQIEDLVSTGGSCIKEIEAYRKKNTKVFKCLAIFSYDFPEILQKFEEAQCRLKAALTYDTLLSVAIDKGAIKPEHYEMLKEWRTDPFNWGAKYGFPKVEKK